MYNNASDINLRLYNNANYINSININCTAVIAPSYKIL